MQNIKILIDTNILIDYIANREPYAIDADRIIELCVQGNIDGCIAAHTVTNLFYILRKELSFVKRRELLRKLCQVFTVVAIDAVNLDIALQNSKFNDLEDCLQDVCAEAFGAKYIITRNVKDFANANIKAIEPDIFLMNI